MLPEKVKHVSKQSVVEKELGDWLGQVLVLLLAPALSTIPFVGWVIAGWVAMFGGAMFGGNQGAEIGGNMAIKIVN